MAECAAATGDLYSCFSSDVHQIGLNHLLVNQVEACLPSAHHKDFQRGSVQEKMSSDLSSLHTEVQKDQQVTVTSSSAPEPLPQRRKRTVYSQAQLDALEQFFRSNMYPDIHHREYLATQINLPESRIHVWFQNRRAKVRRDGRKSTLFPMLREQCSSTPVVNKDISSSLTMSHLSKAWCQQEKLHEPPHQDQPEWKSKQYFGNQSHETSHTMSRQKILVHHLNTSSSVLSANRTGNWHNVNRGRPVIAGFQNKVMDLSVRHVSMNADLKIDYDNFPPNRTIGPEMNVVIPPIPSSKSSTDEKRNTDFTKKKPHLTIGYNGQYTSFSGSGDSDRSTDLKTDWKRRSLISVYHHLD
ncbi:homeobox protein Mix.1-like [Bombina bombina]|uniref:homeobox protein Mix.1-like n=1 Tax=Bombina bombina TaxID=8345 RepID=UPI00235AF2D0|nr:homeobox protein Mix.1-like [Bombina bombina]